MSTLQVDAFEVGAPTAEIEPSFSTAGALSKASWNYDKTVPNVDESNNVASITDVATGDFDVSLTNNMANTTWRYCGNDANSGATTDDSMIDIVVGKLTTGSSFYLKYSTQTIQALGDVADVVGDILGDLA